LETVGLTQEISALSDFGFEVIQNATNSSADTEVRQTGLSLRIAWMAVMQEKNWLSPQVRQWRLLEEKSCLRSGHQRIQKHPDRIEACWAEHRQREDDNDAE
jgi:hypothetical protein